MKKQQLHIFSILAIALFLFMAIGSSDSSSDSSDGGQRLTAYDYAEKFVKQTLKSPSTAEFPGLFEKDKDITEVGDGVYLIDSYVDSQNGFGAMLRTKFKCKIKFTDTKVKCLSLIVDGKQIIP